MFRGDGLLILVLFILLCFFLDGLFWAMDHTAMLN